MKHFNFKILMFCCVASVYVVGCGGQDFCKIDCGANGACLDGLCTCGDGYEGDRCEIASNLKFIGRWKGQEAHQYNGVTDTIKIDWTAQASTLPFDLKIKAANDSVRILNLKGDKLTVLKEIVLDNKHIIKSGTATINAAKTQINYQFQYKAVDTIPAFSGSGVLFKQ